MTLKEKIDNDIKQAMKNKEQGALRALRAIKSAILLQETAEDRVPGPLTPDEEVKLLMKQAKQRKDSIDQFRKNNRNDLADSEEEELKIIERYLPQQLSEEELKKVIQMLIQETGTTSIKDMGKIMKALGEKHGSQVDNKKASEIIKELLK